MRQPRTVLTATALAGLSLCVIVLLGRCSTPVEAEPDAGSRLRPVPTHPPGPTASEPPSPTPTASPTASPTPTTPPPATPDRIQAAATESTSRSWEATVERCIGYLPLVYRWWPEFPTDPDLTLAVAAAESGCDPSAESYAGAVGLMQVVPAVWSASRADLMDTAWNVRIGMWILRSAIDGADGNLPRALAVYNCGEGGVDRGECGQTGGYVYAEQVLTLWRPMTRARLDLLAEHGREPGMTDWWDTYVEWLRDLGYGGDT